MSLRATEASIGIVKCSIDPLYFTKIIAVTGTNGKGSTCKLIGLLIKEAGHSVGVFTNPSFVSRNDQFKINNVDVTDDKLNAATSYILSCYPEVNHHTLDFLVALKLFQDADVEYAVIETMSGGISDSAYGIDADIVVITSISKDNMAVVGRTLEHIADNKMGLAKAGSTMICNKNVVGYSAIDKAKERGVKVITDGQDFSNAIDVHTSFPLINASIAIQAVKTSGIEPLNVESVISNYSSVGHYQKFIIGSNTLIVDYAHNSEAINLLVERVNDEFCGIPVYITALFCRDKQESHSDMFESLSSLSTDWILYKIDTKIVLTPLEMSKKFNIDPTVLDDVYDLINYIKENVEDSCIIATGSLNLCCEINKALKGYTDVA